MHLKLISQAVLVSLGMAVATFSVSRADAQSQDPVAVAHHTEAVSSAPAAADSLNVNVAAGATLNGGNSESYAANGGGRLVLVRQPHQLTIEALGTLAYSKDPNPPHHVNRTAGAAIGRARYDLYLTRMDALFLAIQPRRDLYAGLQLRLQNQAGYLRNLYFPQDGHRLWTELGYDLTYDKFESIKTSVSNTTATGPNETTTVTTTTASPAGHAFVHSGRVFLGYTNQLHPVATVNLGVETLYDVKDKKNVRVNGTAELNSTLSARFKLGVQFRILFDNEPVPKGLKKYDTITALQLIYSYDSLAGKTPPPCPACDCSGEVAAAKASCSAQPIAPEGEPSVPAASAEPAVPAEPSQPAAAEQQPSVPVSAGATP